IGKVELHCEKNNTAHNTNDISVNRLIVRRGQSFLVTFDFHGPFRPTTDILELMVETGPQPSEALGTRSVFGIPEGRGKGSSWKVEVHPGSVLLEGSITLDITSPADAPVGEYSLSVKTSANATVGRSLGKLLLLFNPWCQDDIVDICLKLLDVNPKCLRDPAKDFSARCNPIYVNIGKVELHCEKNNTAHNTNDISVNRLIVRRGQSFLVTFDLHGPFRPTTDMLELMVETGPQPSEALGTRSVFGIPEGRGKGSSWKVEVHPDSVLLEGSITLDITSPADAPVGEYSLSVKTSANATVGRSLGKLLLLFNPWCQ
ncbi:unnamed protein product, partial [Coregonus sp. 'balchen']